MISYMKKILAIGLFSILTVACTPYFVSYKHLYIEDQAGLSVVEYGNPIVNENIKHWICIWPRCYLVKTNYMDIHRSSNLKN